MALNKNHEFEELNGVKCGIVEKNVSASRLSFIKSLLESNGYTVVAVPSPAPKAAAAAGAAPAATPAAATTPSTSAAAPASTTETAAPTPATAAPAAPETFTVGVTDYTFNVVNALFGRSLKTSDGHIVTPAYWQQREAVSHDEIPYYERG